jgi:hypothetical protein
VTLRKGMAKTTIAAIGTIMKSSRSGKRFCFTLYLCGFCQDDNPTVNLSANTITAATMQEIVANTISGLALWEVTSPMMPAILRIGAGA